MLKEYRPDLAFVVTADVWRDFQRVRDETGDALCLGFLQTCEDHIRAGEESGDMAKARHWRSVLNLADHYGVSFVSAIEVDGEIIREHEKSPLWSYPADADLTRKVIDADALYVAPRSEPTILAPLVAP